MLETVAFDTDAMKVALVFRGSLETAALGIASLVVTAEDLAETPATLGEDR